MFACYEKNYCNEYQLVVYHEPLLDRNSLNGKNEDRTTLRRVPDDCIDECGEPIMGKIAVWYPNPKKEENNG